MFRNLHQWQANTRRFVTVGLTTILFAFGPMLGAVSIGEAKPPDHAPAWGYRRKSNNDSWSRRKRSTRRYRNTRRYRSNKRYNKRYRSNYRYNTRRSYTTRDLGNKNHIRKRKYKNLKKSQKKSQKKRERRRN